MSFTHTYVWPCMPQQKKDAPEIKQEEIVEKKEEQLIEDTTLNEAEKEPAETKQVSNDDSVPQVSMTTETPVKKTSKKQKSATKK